MDGNATDHAYPRRSDPNYNAFNLGITTFTTNTFTVNVGISSIVNYNVSNASYIPTTGQLTLNIGNHSLKSGVTTTVQGAEYSPITGIMTVTIANHEYSAGERIKFDTESLRFSCTTGPDIKAYPRVNDYANNKWLPISNVTANTFEVQVLGPDGYPSTSTGIHTFINAVGNMKKGGESIKIATNSLTFTCDMDNHGSEHSYPRTTDPYYNTSIPIVSTTSDTITVNVGISSLVYHTPTDATYNPANGDLVVTIGSHKLMVGKNVKIATGSIGFTCDKDNNTVTKFYPRENKDPAYNTSVAVGATTLNTVTLQIGAQAGGLVAPLQMEFLASILENSTT